MPEVTYDQLKNNVVEEKVNGATMHVTFKCPSTDKTFDASAPMPRKDGVGARMKTKAKNEMLYAAKRGFRRLLRGVFGGGAVGRAASNVGSSAVGHGGRASVEYDKKGGVVAAFESIQENFAWDAGRQAYVDATGMEGMVGEFDTQLQNHPLASQWDKGVAARMMAEIIAADGDVGDDEREFFEGFVNDDTGTLNEIIEKGKLSRVELEETTPDSRATMFMLACAVAFSDEELDDAEIARLSEFAEQLGIRPDREKALKQYACEKVIENTLSGYYADGELDEDERISINGMAAGIGVDETLVERLDVRVRKRLGIM